MRVSLQETIDDIDLKIINVLKDNARISYKNLSKIINLSVPAVFARTKRLEENGIIQGYKTSIDYCKIGLPIHVFILLHDDRYRDGIPDMLNKIDCIFNFWIVSGGYDYLLEVYLPSNHQLDDLLNALYKIGRTHTMLILNKLKEDSLT